MAPEPDQALNTEDSSEIQHGPFLAAKVFFIVGPVEAEEDGVCDKERPAVEARGGFDGYKELRGGDGGGVD